MITKLFASAPIPEEETIAWLFDVFAWALEQFGAEVFFNETVLVAPTNEFFPGQENTAGGMAALIFSQVQQYAKLQHWNFQVVDQREFVAPDLSQLVLPGKTRGSLLGGSTERVTSSDETRIETLPVPFDPQMVMNPEAMISSYAHVLAQYLGSQASENPPGGSDNWLLVTELLGVYLGFGLMYANSAVTAPSSCSSCSAGLATRPSFVSQYDLTYSLAIFAVLKNVPDKQVVKHLKKPLRGYYKTAVKDVKTRTKELQTLLGLRNKGIVPNASAALNNS